MGSEMCIRDRCTACGDCVDACPYDTIQLSKQDERPVIFPDQTPCYVCDDFPCVAACETEALLPIQEGIAGVNLGKARVNRQRCTAADPIPLV